MGERWGEVGGGGAAAALPPGRRQHLSTGVSMNAFTQIGSRRVHGVGPHRGSICTTYFSLTSICLICNKGSWAGCLTSTLLPPCSACPPRSLGTQRSLGDPRGIPGGSEDPRERWGVPTGSPKYPRGSLGHPGSRGSRGSKGAWGSKGTTRGPRGASLWGFPEDPQRNPRGVTGQKKRSPWQARSF